MKHFNPFRLPKPEEIRRQQLQDAERMALEHQAAAEHHAALARMYQERITRLTASA